ncbi:leucokinins [Malaya genurostris]|uniref:leucokinins n=1 Tax=Malaya genurostris TaxID=325434 RepID=UPI0026F380B9|nr:leucokinins [Malaya genurostris]
MKISIHLAFTLLAAVVGFRCSELKASDKRLVEIISDCEWTARKNLISETLLDRYRRHVMNSFFQHNDVCAVHEWSKHVRMIKLSDENGLDEVEESDADGEKYRETNLPPASFLAQSTNLTCSASAKDFYSCILNQYGDTTLNTMILENLKDICEHRRKRNSKYVSKQKFYSWGGKRNNAHIFFPWGGKRNFASSRIQRQPKVVIRNPFHSWGGKRSPPDARRF